MTATRSLLVCFSFISSPLLLWCVGAAFTCADAWLCVPVLLLCLCHSRTLFVPVFAFPSEVSCWDSEPDVSISTRSSPFMAVVLTHFSLGSFSHPQTLSLMATPWVITGGGITRRRMHSARAVRLPRCRPRCASSTLDVGPAAVPSIWFISTPPPR